MILQYKEIEKRPRIFRTLTGLDRAEFENLIPLFGDAYKEYTEDTYVKGKQRIRAYGGGRTPTLRTDPDRLFFFSEPISKLPALMPKKIVSLP